MSKLFVQKAKEFAGMSRLLQYMNVEFKNLEAIDVEKLLISMGLRTTYYGVPSRTKKWNIVYHIWCIFILFVTAVRFTLPSLIPELEFVCGDISGYIGGKKEYYLVAFTGWGWHAFTQSLLSFIWRDDKKMFEWLRPYAMCNKRLMPYEINLTDVEAIKLWKRTKLMVIGFWLMYSVAFIFANITVLFVAFVRMPQEYVDRFALGHILLHVLWVTYDAGLLILVLNIFHSTCYYICIRYDKVEQDTQLVLKTRAISKEDRSKMILSIVREHNQISVTLDNYNKYWQVFALGAFLIYIAIVCTWLYLGIYEYLDLFFIKAYVYSLVTLTFFSLTYIALSAAMVSKKASLFYKSGNSLMKLDFDAKVRIKLCTYVKRKVGMSTMGFHPLGIFTFTFETYYLILGNIVAYFLLATDIAQRSKQ